MWLDVLPLGDMLVGRDRMLLSVGDDTVRADVLPERRRLPQQDQWNLWLSGGHHNLRHRQLAALLPGRDVLRRSHGLLGAPEGDRVLPWLPGDVRER
jgi:hypothetical protein